MGRCVCKSTIRRGWLCKRPSPLYKSERDRSAAEEAGFDHFAIADHVWQHPIMGCPEENEPECCAMISFLAAHTERVKLGAMVSGVHFKHPATCGGNGRGQLVMSRSVFRSGSLALYFLFLREVA
jgi:hypothetical protein